MLKIVTRVTQAAVLLSTLSLHAEIIILNPDVSVKASDINNNFDHVNSLLSEKGATIPFKVFASGEVIKRSDLEANFQYLRIAGISIPALGTKKVKSSELNLAFSSIINAILDLPVASASGGLVSTQGNYKIHTFTSLGSSNFSLANTFNAKTNVEYLVVGGGGGAGGFSAGGGGGGAVKSGTLLLDPGTYSLTVGAGGLGKYVYQETFYEGMGSVIAYAAPSYLTRISSASAVGSSGFVLRSNYAVANLDPVLNLTLPTEIGKTYTLGYDIIKSSGSGIAGLRVGVKNGAGANDANTISAKTFSSSSVDSITFTATSANTTIYTQHLADYGIFDIKYLRLLGSDPTSGSSSLFSSISAAGGGHGGDNVFASPGNGASGGGGNYNNPTAVGLGSDGSNGGAGFVGLVHYKGGGGGGAGGAGASGANVLGAPSEDRWESGPYEVYEDKNSKICNWRWGSNTVNILNAPCQKQTVYAGNYQYVRGSVAVSGASWAAYRIIRTPVVSYGGAGGAGMASSITGEIKYFGAGGAGGVGGLASSLGSVGGSSVGGSSGTKSSPGTSGAVNSGSGGGAGYSEIETPSRTSGGGKGGSGIVILKYRYK